MHSFASLFQNMRSKFLRKGSFSQNLSSKVTLKKPSLSGRDPVDSVHQFAVKLPHQLPQPWVSQLHQIIEELTAFQDSLKEEPLPTSDGASPSPLEQMGEALKTELQQFQPLLPPEKEEACTTALWKGFYRLTQIQESLLSFSPLAPWAPESLLKLYQDLLEVRAQLHFQTANLEISSTSQNLLAQLSSVIHRLLSQFPLPHRHPENEGNQELIAFYHAMEHLMNTLSLWCFKGRSSQPARLAMYLDLFDSVQRSNLLEITQDHFSGFVTRLIHIKEFLDITKELLPPQMMESFKETLYSGKELFSPAPLTYRVEELLVSMDLLEVPEEYQGHLDSVRAELLTLCLPSALGEEPSKQQLAKEAALAAQKLHSILQAEGLGIHR